MTGVLLGADLGTSGLKVVVRPSAEVVRTAALPVGEVPVVVGGADTPPALLAAAPAPAGRSTWAPAPRCCGPGGRRRPPTTHRCTATPTSRTAGTRWPRCRTAAWRGRGCGVLGLTPAELFDAAATVPTGAGG